MRLCHCLHNVIEGHVLPQPQAFDMAYMLNGKYALKHDPTLTGGGPGKYL